MIKRETLLLGLLMCVPVVSRAQVGCKTIADAAKRLACYDTSGTAKPLRVPAKPESSTVVPSVPIPLGDAVGRRELPDFRANIQLTRSASVPERSSAPHPGTVTETFDRFDNQTHVELLRLKFPWGLEMHSYYLMPGTTPSRPAVVGLIFSMKSDTWRYLKCHTLRLLSDGREIDLSESHDGEVGTGYVLEFITAKLPSQAFLEAVNGALIEGKLCNDVFTFDLPMMTALRDFASRMQPEKH